MDLVYGRISIRVNLMWREGFKLRFSFKILHREKMAFKHTVEEEGGKLPAEHGHGVEYHAPESSQKRWMAMDPLNLFNPGVGGLPTLPKYGK